MDKHVNNPKVSVLIPAYNAEAYIGAAIQSILNQTWSDFELIVINDSSTDNTGKQIEYFTDPRVRYVHNDTNQGLKAIRNQALALARGTYVAWLDADDLSLPRRLEREVQFLDSHKDFALVGTWVELIDEHGKKTGVAWKNRKKPEDMRAALFFGNQFAQSSVMMRKRDLPNPPYRIEYAPAEDHDLWIRLAEHKGLFTIPEVLTRYRILQKSAVHGNDKQKVAREKILTDNLLRLGIIPSEEERILHQTNFGFSSGNKRSFLERREQWLLKLIQANHNRKIFNGDSFKKIAAEQWLISCRANATGTDTWKRCFRSPLASYISWKENWRVIIKFALETWGIIP